MIRTLRPSRSLPGRSSWPATTRGLNWAAGCMTYSIKITAEFLWRTAARPAYRKQCDTILAYEAMPDLSATAFQCSAVYQALRRFGQGWPGDSFWERFT